MAEVRSFGRHRQEQPGDEGKTPQHRRRHGGVTTGFATVPFEGLPVLVRQRG